MTSRWILGTAIAVGSIVARISVSLTTVTPVTGGEVTRKVVLPLNPDPMMVMDSPPTAFTVEGEIENTCTKRVSTGVGVGVGVVVGALPQPSPENAANAVSAARTVRENRFISMFALLAFQSIEHNQASGVHKKQSISPEARSPSSTPTSLVVPTSSKYTSSDANPYPL